MTTPITTLSKPTPSSQPTHPTPSVGNPPHPEPQVTTWLKALLPPIQSLCIFGGSITFTLIVASNAPPTKHFTEQTVRDLLSLAWLFFALALAISIVFGVVINAFDETMQKYMAPFLTFCLGGCIFSAILLLSLVMLAYSDVGWAAIALTVLGIVPCLAGWIAFNFFRAQLPLLGLRPMFEWEKFRKSRCSLDASMKAARYRVYRQPLWSQSGFSDLVPISRLYVGNQHLYF